MKLLLTALFASLATSLASPAGSAQAPASPIHTETLVQSTSSWDGTPYKSYPTGQPKITVLKITIAPHTTMKWHSHPLPSAGYVLSGSITVEKPDGTKRHVTAGEAVTETVDSVHRGSTGDEPAVLIVFYSGADGVPLSVAQ